MSYTHEITYLVRNEEDASFVPSHLQKIGAEMERGEALRKIQLAYPIKKESFVFLGIIRFRADASRLSELHANLRLEDRILRYLITRPARLRAEAHGERGAREGLPLGRGPMEGRRSFSAPPIPQILSNEALQEKIEEILQ